MPIRTLTGRAMFDYTGNCVDGFYLEYTGRPFVSPELINEILIQFQGATIPGGFSMTSPTPGGLGAWLAANTNFTPRHGSHIAAVMAHEGFITYQIEGNRVLLQFPEVQQSG